jgi:CTP synthase
VRVLVVGEEEHLRDVYPAVLAALGDAAGSLHLNIAMAIASPRGLCATTAAEALDGIDAMVLPGGCDPSQVDGQIQLARAALKRDVPTLGMCFGMQTMTTAVVRARLGERGAHLEEVRPDASPLVFRCMMRQDSSGWHRLGCRAFTIAAGTLAHSIYRAGLAEERMHHRFRLEPGLFGSLAGEGLIVSGYCGRDEIADVIEVPDRRFFLGIQGHPELQSGPSRPHPAFLALLEEASKLASQHERTAP